MKIDPTVAQPLLHETLLAVTDAQGRLLYRSPDLERLLGKNTARLLGDGDLASERSPWASGRVPWTVEQAESRPSGAGSASAAAGTTDKHAPTLQWARVRLHDSRRHGAPSHSGPDSPLPGRSSGAADHPSSAFLTSLLLPGTGVSLHSFQLERSAGTLHPEQLQQLLDQLPVGVVGVGVNGELLYVKAQAIENAQMPADTQQYIGLNDLQYAQLRGLDLDRARARSRHLQTAMRERRSVTWTDQVPRPGQAPQYWRRSYTPVYDGHGDLSLIAGMGIHVSEEVQRTAELELLVQVVRNNPDAMPVVDLAEEIADSRVIFANRVAERLMGGRGAEVQSIPGQLHLSGLTLQEIADQGLDPDQQAVLLCPTGRPSCRHSLNSCGSP